MHSLVSVLVDARLAFAVEPFLGNAETAILKLSEEFENLIVLNLTDNINFKSDDKDLRLDPYHFNQNIYNLFAQKIINTNIFNQFTNNDQ